ncbi:MAG: hypothetical protein EOM40_08095 [Clostridia bacterium]|nr:hypothetical protein [Clostridia bacterium]
MTLGYAVRKAILPVALIAIWSWLVYTFCNMNGYTEAWQIWMGIGIPFGIHRMCLWIIPRNYDIGGGLGVLCINIIVGAVIGGLVVVWYIFRAVWTLLQFGIQTI